MFTKYKYQDFMQIQFITTVPCFPKGGSIMNQNMLEN